MRGVGQAAANVFVAGVEVKVGVNLVSPRPLFVTIFFLNPFLSARVFVVEKQTTSNGGPLGSCIDEERSKLRYLV